MNGRGKEDVKREIEREGAPGQLLCEIRWAAAGGRTSPLLPTAAALYYCCCPLLLLRATSPPFNRAQQSHRLFSFFILHFLLLFPGQSFK